jgi:hypothetical protein
MKGTNMISPDEKRWRAEDDARTLAQAEQIKADRERLQSAKDAAARLLAEEEERIRGMRKIARSSSSATSKKPTSTAKPSNGFNTFERI